MMHAPARRVACVTLVLLAPFAVACSDRIGHGWDRERMRSQPRYEAYGRSALFADGKAMQVAPPGTVSRESGDAAATMPNDLSRLALLERGADRFAIFCAVCHGDRADGNSVVASNMDAPRPPSLVDSARRALSPAQVYAVATHGVGRMPPFAAALSVADRWAVAAYVAELRRPAASGTTAHRP
jgi:mono/diheme cytochrome c family protein